VSRYGRIRALLLVAVLAMAVCVWATSRIQATADDGSTRALAAGQRMLIAMLDQETGLRGFINTRRQEFLEPYRRGRLQFDEGVADARVHATEAKDRALIAQQVAIARRWQALAQGAVAQVSAGHDAMGIAAARQRKGVMDRFRAANATFNTAKGADRRHDQKLGNEISVAAIVALGLLFAAVGWLIVERPARADVARRRRLAEFGDALQVARSEREAFDVLKRHLERWLERSRAVVLIRNSSANRLQAATGLEQTPVLASKLEGVAPESCLSVRLAKPYARKPGDDSLLVCDICGQLPESSTCVPTVVGGEVVGSVLVQVPQSLDEHELEDLQSSVSSAGPVIANLRNLAVAELRAATDALTGLANHRAVQDTLNRMVAQAGRTTTQLSCILFDLDHFKRVNDIHGHAKGDEVLAAVGGAVDAVVRDSDFVGRYGGEEFVVLLPDTGAEGGMMLAEKLRTTIEALEIPDLDRRLSASFGVAVFPVHAVTGDQLMRAADRALYAAKGNGRNRVELVRSGSGEGGRQTAEAR
jgi:diguanylate cyclase (GGDEF)-like protein